MKLFFDSEYLGEIDTVTMDDFWQIGVFHPLPTAARFSDLFAFLAKEDKQPNDEPPVDDDVIFGDHWTIVDDEGQTRKIIAPAVHEDGEISWQWK
jgi:hypothetical protein